MQTEIKNTTNSICKCDFKAPPLRVLRQPGYCQDLAQFCEELGLSGVATLYWVEAQLFDHHDGKLFDHNGELMEVRDDPKFTDNIWGEDERRTVRRFLERALKEFTNLLQMRMVKVVTLLGFARSIHNCRTTGKCSCKTE